MIKDEFVKEMVLSGYTRDEINRMIGSGKEFDESEKNAFIKKAMQKQGYSSASADKMVNQSRRPIKSSRNMEAVAVAESISGVEKAYDKGSEILVYLEDKGNNAEAEKILDNLIKTLEDEYDNYDFKGSIEYHGGSYVIVLEPELFSSRRKSVKSVSRKVNSAVEQHYGDHGYNSVYNQFGSIFDYDWFAETNNEDKEYLMDEFLQDFHDWLVANGENVDEYAGYNFDVEYEFEKYLEDKPCPEIIEIFELINEWLEKENSFATSADYLGGLYRYSAGAADIEFYANSDDIKFNAEELFKEQRYTEKDITHGFKSADDLVKAVMECVDQGDVEDVDEYDAGSYGYHKLNTEGDYFETGSCFLGNGEETYDLPCPVPIDEKYFGYANVAGPWVTYKGDLIYTSSTMMFIYGIPWSKVEEKGHELGLIGGDFKGNESSNEDEDDIPRF